MNVVFDFGGVLFRWRPTELIARLLPERAADAPAAQALAADFFQSHDGDWGDFDRGSVEPDALAERIASLHRDQADDPASASGRGADLV